MSGVVEVVGVSLAVVPLVVSAIEHYEVAFRPLVTYCHYGKKLRDFKDRLNFQKRMFQSHCTILLGKVRADYILENLSIAQTKWIQSVLSEEDQAVEERLAFYLGPGNYQACASLIRAVQDTLLKIQGDWKGIDEEIEKSSEEMNLKVSLNQWIHCLF